MAITDTTSPYEILFRFADGKLAGTHYQEIRVIADDGVPISTSLLDPVAISEGDQSVLGTALSAAMATNTDLSSQIAQLQQNLTVVQGQNAVLQQALADAQARIPTQPDPVEETTNAEV